MEISYRPQTLTDFLGNDEQKKVMDAFLKDTSHTGGHIIKDTKKGGGGGKKEKNRNSMIIIAPSGMGKTTFCDLFFSQYDVFVIRPFYELFSCHRQFVEFLESSIRTVNILKSKQQKVIFLDDVDILFSNDRYSSTYIQSLIDRIREQRLPIKVIITCSVDDERKLCDFKKTTNVLKLESPSLLDCQRVVMGLLQQPDHPSVTCQSKESKEYTHSTKSLPPAKFCDALGLTSIIKILKCNLRSIVSNLHMFKTFATEEEKDHQKFHNLNIFEACKAILDSNQQNNISATHLSDASLITLILYDNIRSYMDMYYAPKLDPYLSGFHSVLDAYVFGSQVEANAYDNCCWQNIEAANYIKLGAISLFQNSMKKTIKRNKNKNKNDERVFQIQYTTITTRACQHYSNTKKLQKYSSNIGLSCDNVRLMCEVAFENQKKDVYRKHIRYSEIAEESILISNYIRNICHPQNHVFSQKLRRIWKINITKGNIPKSKVSVCRRLSKK